MSAFDMPQHRMRDVNVLRIYVAFDFDKSTKILCWKPCGDGALTNFQCGVRNLCKTNSVSCHGEVLCLYCTTSAVNLRSQEIGIRMALGAQREGVLWMVLCQGMRTVALGRALGLLAAVAKSRLLSGLLYGVGTADGPAFIGKAAVRLFVAFIANFVPARRATYVDPIKVMRYE